MPSHPTPHSCPTPLPSTHAPPTPHHACVCIFMCVCKGGREGSLGLDSNEGGVDVDVDGERNAVTPAHQGSHLGTPGRTPGHRTRALNPGHQQGEHLGTKATQAHTRGGHSGGGLKGACACGGNDGCRGIRGVGRAQKAVLPHSTSTASVKESVQSGGPASTRDTSVTHVVARVACRVGRESHKQRRGT
jgi:hypothetical protein